MQYYFYAATLFLTIKINRKDIKNSFLFIEINLFGDSRKNIVKFLFSYHVLLPNNTEVSKKQEKADQKIEIQTKKSDVEILPFL